MATSTYKKLDSYTVGVGGASTVTFSNISQAYTDLIIKVSARSNRVSAYSFLCLTFNGYSLNGNYYDNQVYADSSAAQVNNSGIGTNTIFASFIDASSATSNSFAGVDINVQNYTSNTWKLTLSEGAMVNNASVTQLINKDGGVFYNNSPITSITLSDASGSFVQYSTFTLYGVYNQDVANAPSAPTIGTATDAGTNDSASITFTPNGSAGIYTMTSSPSGITGIGTSSPITVTGLSLGTAYTFSCMASNPRGTSSASSASNSITLAGVASYELISTTALSGTSTTITNLPTSGYKHLQISIMSQHNYTNFAGVVSLKFNGDSSASYTYHQILSDYSQTAPILYNSTASNYYKMGTHPGTYQAGYWGTYTIDILDYLSPDKYKSIFSNGGDGGLSYPRNWLSSGSWLSASPINRITVTTVDGSFVTGSQISIYGVR